MLYLAVLLLLLNLFSFALFVIDKRLAIHKKHRISENTLLFSSFCFGALGALLGMILAHHKTKKPKFYLLIPLFLLCQVAGLLFWLMQ